MGSDFVDDHENDEEDEQERPEENPRREHNVVLADRDAARTVHRTEHGDEILSHPDILAETNGAEKRDEVAGDGGVIGCSHIAKEIDDILVRLAVEVDVPEEDDNVASHIAVGFDIAEKADGVVDWSAGCDLNVVEELNRIVLGASRPSGESQSGPEKTKGQKPSMHRCALLATNSLYAGSDGKVPGEDSPAK